MFKRKSEEQLELERNAKEKTITDEERIRREKVLRKIYADPYFENTPTDDEGAMYHHPKELKAKISRKRLFTVTVMVVGLIAVAFLFAYLVECFIRFIGK